MICIEKIEAQRQIIQRELDLLKTQEQRNILGQFSTPTILANDILRNALKLMPTGDKIRFLDPAIGTGAFFSALNKNVCSPTCIEAATGYEIDEHYGKPAFDLWSKSILDYQLNDFTKVAPPLNESEKFNLIICNPPYVRHHHINGQKERLHVDAIAAANMKLSGLAGLYCYFMALSHRWMRSNGIAGWLIPSEFMDVNYGRAVKEYLLNEVSLLQIHRFDPKDAQFDDALVSSAVVWFRNRKPDLTHIPHFNFYDTYWSRKLDILAILPLETDRSPQPKIRLFSCYFPEVRNVGSKSSSQVYLWWFDRTSRSRENRQCEHISK